MPRPSPPCCRRCGAVGLREPLEDVRQEGRLDALSGVGDDDDDIVAGVLHLDAHASAARRELDRVRQQVPHDLLEAVLVGDDRRELAEHGLDG